MKVRHHMAELVLVAFDVHAGIICHQQPAAGNAGRLSTTYSNGGSNLEEFFRDSFSTATTQMLRELHWRCLAHCH